MKTQTIGKPMAKTQRITWADLPADVLKEVSDMCDGHGIFAPAALLEAGVPQELVDRYTDTFESDLSDPKQTIFSNKTGAPVNHMRGVYGYNVLSGIVHELNLPYTPKLGRGFQARIWQEAIDNYIKQLIEGK
jgi:hypothetical protein